MKCQTCNGATVIPTTVKAGNGYDLLVTGAIPCPDCLGGEQHCCDGECAQPTINTGVPATGSFDR